MNKLIVNAYSSIPTKFEIDFDHELNCIRDQSDPELAPHLNGLAGFVLYEKKMTATLYHVWRHVQKVKTHYSFNISEDQFENLSKWANKTCSILFFPDSTVRDPNRKVLAYPDGREPDNDFSVPYPEDAIRRKEESEIKIDSLGIKVIKSLPPVIGEQELILRNPIEIFNRMYSMFAVSIRAESVACKNKISTKEISNIFPNCFQNITPLEKKFIKSFFPSKSDAIKFTWNYEAVSVFLWVLGLKKEIPFPNKICDAKELASIIKTININNLESILKIIPTSKILDNLDLIFRIHWCVRESQQGRIEMPKDLDGGVVLERHKALNWLVRFENAEWDEVDTPT